jgi:enoyl-CoA hydratase/carnithine racemase
VSGIRVERQGRTAVLRMDKARGNAIDEPFTEELLAACRDLGADDGVAAVMLASAHPKLFCPGLDLVTLHAYDRPALERFVRTFSQLVLALFSLRKPMVAAVAGHAVAGGCVLALTADHRMLRRGSQIGLNEVRVGLPLPWPVAILLKASVVPTALSRVALLGQNFADEEAQAVGLVHEVAEAEGFEEACRRRLEEFAERDVAAVGTTKAYLREAALVEMRAQESTRLPEFLDAWFSPSGQEKIRQTIEALAKKG